MKTKFGVLLALVAVMSIPWGMAVAQDGDPGGGICGPVPCDVIASFDFPVPVTRWEVTSVAINDRTQSIRCYQGTSTGRMPQYFDIECRPDGCNTTIQLFNPDPGEGYKTCQVFNGRVTRMVGTP